MSIAEILDEYEQGMITSHEVFPALLRLALTDPLDRIIADTPEPWRTRFVAWLEATYDNDTPEEEFIWLHSSGAEPEGARRVITVAREWLARNPAR